MTDDRTITDRLATIEQQLARILEIIDPDPTPPQFSHGGPQELPVTIQDGRLIVNGRSDE